MASRGSNRADNTSNSVQIIHHVAYLSELDRAHLGEAERSLIRIWTLQKEDLEASELKPASSVYYTRQRERTKSVREGNES